MKWNDQWTSDLTFRLGIPEAARYVFGGEVQPEFWDIVSGRRNRLMSMLGSQGAGWDAAYREQIGILDDILAARNGGGGFVDDRDPGGFIAGDIGGGNGSKGMGLAIAAGLALWALSRRR